MINQMLTPLVDTIQCTLSPSLIQEVHALLWIDPFVNRGVYDPGWNCRDHALIVAGILAANSVPVQIVHGRVMFVLGPSGSYPPVGRGQDVDDSRTHTWVEVPSIGIVDISPNLRTRDHAKWRPTNFDGIIASRWIPEDNCIVRQVVSAFEYEREIALATHRQEQCSAVYWGRDKDVFSPKLFKNAFDYANSPLTDKLRQNFQQSIYAKITLPLIDRTRGFGRSLATVSRNKAWQIISRRPDNTVEELTKLLANMLPG